MIFIIVLSVAVILMFPVWWEITKRDEYDWKRFQEEYPDWFIKKETPDQEFLDIKDIPIGSWWASAQGGKYGYCVVGRKEEINDVEVLQTDGRIKYIDAFKLQYRYKRVIPNE